MKKANLTDEDSFNTAIIKQSITLIAPSQLPLELSLFESKYAICLISTKSPSISKDLYLFEEMKKLMKSVVRIFEIPKDPQS